MPDNLLNRIKHSPVLCDGAMGTLLYSKGIFINRCYDELNISQPELIAAIHADYVANGAEILETNTFGANSFRLGRHGCQSNLEHINRAGVELARKAIRGANVYVAGAVGPLGVRIEPLGKTGRDEARAHVPACSTRTGPVAGPATLPATARASGPGCRAGAASD